MRKCELGFIIKFYYALIENKLTENVNLRKTDNIIAKRKRTKGQTVIY